MKSRIIFLISFLLIFISPFSLAEVNRSEANNGNLVMEDVPPIPPEIISDLNRYQNVRSAGFQDWTEGGDGIFVTTRFGDVSQIHHVGHPGGARTQLTFFNEPTGGVSRQPEGRKWCSPWTPAAASSPRYS